MSRLTIPKEEFMYSGHTACPGCAATLAMRYLLKGLGQRTIISMPACCWAVISGPYPQTGLKVPHLDTAFESTGASISGLRAALDVKGFADVTVVGFAGDGGTADIGLQSFSGFLERGTNAIYVMYDNEAYMNTGVQRSSSTPFGAWTTTTPLGLERSWKAESKKDMMAIAVAHGVPYAATASVAFAEDFVKKVQKAKGIKGPRFLQVLAPCPPGWRFPPERTIDIAKLAVDTNIYPLYEVEYGVYHITRKIGRPKKVSDYIEAQGRFGHLNPEVIAQIQKAVNEGWQRLLELEEFTSRRKLVNAGWG